MNKYQEHEIKVLNVNIPELQKRLGSIGAKKVFDDDRVFITLDTKDGELKKDKKLLRLTEEGKIKLSISSINAGGKKETIKVFTSRTQETLDLLSKLGYFPISKVKSHRISYELDDIDFDIDQFPEIPAFMEIDLGSSETDISELLEKLGLVDNEQVIMGTEDIFTHYGKDYYELFKIRG